MNNKFVFVTPVYNCEKTIHKTLYSMMAQSYDSWHAIIINDISSDSTLDKINKTINSSIYKDRFTVIDNLEKHGEVRNTLQAIKTIDDNSIVCRVDGGDWITENDCLYVLNKCYNTYDPAVMWTSHRWAYTNQNISNRLDMKKFKSVYDHPWVSSHMKTFRCKYLKEVDDKNFRDENGDYIMIACDQAIFLPMMHLGHIQGKELLHLPMVCYHYSIDLEKEDLFTCDRSINQRDSALFLRKRGYVE